MQIKSSDSVRRLQAAAPRLALISLVLLLLLCDVGARHLTVDVQRALLKCDKRGETFCDVGFTPNQAEINSAIERSKHLKKYRRWKQEEEDEQTADPSRTRRKKREEPTVDCSGVCCVRLAKTEPKSFFKDKDGWQQIASTPQNPQRAQFETATCQNPKAPCRGVKAESAGFRAGCVQVMRSHVILFYRQDTQEIDSRTIELPSGCSCTLERNPFIATGSRRPSTGRTRPRPS